MDPEQFFTASGVIIVAGKGGVGKTAVASALTTAASAAGLRTVLIELEGKSGIASMFGVEPLRFDEQVLIEAGDGQGGVTARTITPDEALVNYLREHGLSRISNRLVASGAVELVSTAVPGIRDILVLGEVKRLERAGEYDLVVVDAPAAGHAISFLRSAAGLVDAVSVGPINSQAREVLALLGDPRRCRVLLVTAPEETPVNELIETAYSLEDEVGLTLGPVVVNGLLEELPGLEVDPVTAAADAGARLLEGEAEVLAASSDFRRARRALQDAQLDRLAMELPLPQLHLPFMFTTDLDAHDVHHLSEVLWERVEALPTVGSSA